MSMWTYILGTIEVSPCGRTQAEKEYILKTVLDHLPRVTGSEEDMEVYINKEDGTTSSSSTDEFFCESNLLDDGWLQTQDNYLITVKANLRDRMFSETLREFQNWLYRLSKRVLVEDVLVRVKGWKQSIVFTNKNDYYSDLYYMAEVPWCYYLMWDYEQSENGNILCGKPTSHSID